MPDARLRRTRDLYPAPVAPTDALETARLSPLQYRWLMEEINARFKAYLALPLTRPDLAKEHHAR